jgi:magnesium transporter
VVDSFFEVIEQQQEGLLNLEDALMEFGRAPQVSSTSIQQYRRDYIRLSKVLTPFLEGFGETLMMDSAFIKSASILYFRDTYDHLKQVKITLEANRELMASLVDIYLSNNDVRLNRSMNQLTIVATIFIPLTFLVGVWGMNFKNMPELEWKHGYLISWVVMIVIGVAVYAWFKKRMKF